MFIVIFFLLFLLKKLYLSLSTTCLILCSCLIARNLLSGLKTCMEVSTYMRDSNSSMPHKSVAPSSFLEETTKVDTDYAVCKFLVFYSFHCFKESWLNIIFSSDETLQ